MTRKNQPAGAWTLMLICICFLTMTNSALYAQNNNTGLKASGNSQAQTSPPKLDYNIADCTEISIVNHESVDLDRVRWDLTVEVTKDLKDGPYILSFSVPSEYSFIAGQSNKGWAYTSHNTLHYHLGNTLHSHEAISITLYLRKESSSNIIGPLPTFLGQQPMEYCSKS